MHFTITKSHLNDLLKRCLRAINPRAQHPAMLHFLMEAADGCLHVTASDIITTIQASVTATVLQEGKITLPAKKLTQIVDALSAEDDQVSFQASTDHTMVISYHKSKYKLRGLDADQYPPLPDTKEFDRPPDLILPRPDLMRAITKVAYARSADENRKQLNGILLSFRGNTLTIAATDGRRLAFVDKAMPNTALPDFDVILPEKIAIELPRCFPDYGHIYLWFAATQVRFKITYDLSSPADAIETSVTSRLIEGSYPNFRQTVPQGPLSSITIPRAELAAALHRVAMINAESGQPITLSLSDGQVLLSASSTDLGEASESVDIPYDDQPIDISFNPHFLIEPLKTLDADELTLSFKDSFSPATLSDAEGFLYVLMPMRS